MQKTRTQNSRKPRPRIYSSYFESLVAMMRNDPTRFRRFSSSVKYQLSVYLDLKEQSA